MKVTFTHWLGVFLFFVNTTTPYSARKQTPDVAPEDEASLSMNMWVIFSAYMEQGKNNYQIFYQHFLYHTIFKKFETSNKT